MGLGKKNNPKKRVILNSKVVIIIYNTNVQKKIK